MKRPTRNQWYKWIRMAYEGNLVQEATSKNLVGQHYIEFDATEWRALIQGPGWADLDILLEESGVDHWESDDLRGKHTVKIGSFDQFMRLHDIAAQARVQIADKYDDTPSAFDEPGGGKRYTGAALKREAHNTNDRRPKRTCAECGHSVPTTPGRYPLTCPNCGSGNKIESARLEFLQKGQRVHWTDPEGSSTGEYYVVYDSATQDVSAEEYEDDVILIRNDAGSEAEVFRSELSIVESKKTEADSKLKQEREIVGSAPRIFPKHKAIDQWVPATGEQPFEYMNERWQYVWNPATGQKGYHNLGQDIVYDDFRFEEVVDRFDRYVHEGIALEGEFNAPDAERTGDPDLIQLYQQHDRIFDAPWRTKDRSIVRDNEFWRAADQIQKLWEGAVNYFRNHPDVQDAQSYLPMAQMFMGQAQQAGFEDVAGAIHTLDMALSEIHRGLDQVVSHYFQTKMKGERKVKQEGDATYQRGRDEAQKMIETDGLEKAQLRADELYEELNAVGHDYGPENYPIWKEEYATGFNDMVKWFALSGNFGGYGGRTGGTWQGLNEKYQPNPEAILENLDSMRKHKLIPEGALPPLYSQEKVDDPIVHVKLFTPMSSWTWLLLEYDPATKEAFGYAYDAGFPAGAELGYIPIRELENLVTMGIPGVERDLYFDPQPLSKAKAGLGR